MNFTTNKPDQTRISLGEYRIVDGKLEEKVLHIQHKKILDVEPFSWEIWKQIEFNSKDLVFIPSPCEVLCIFTYREHRAVLYKYGSYFIDEKGLGLFIVMALV